MVIGPDGAAWLAAVENLGLKAIPDDAAIVGGGSIDLAAGSEPAAAGAGAAGAGAALGSVTSASIVEGVAGESVGGT